jgi:hypothetical protein
LDRGLKVEALLSLICENGANDFWAGLTPDQKMLSELLLKNATRHIMGMTPLLVECVLRYFQALVLTTTSFGYSPELLLQIQQLAIAELRGGHSRLYTRWHFAWAAKSII